MDKNKLKTKNRLAVFDFDCTLVNAETIDVLAEAYGVGKEVSRITRMSMNNEMDFFDALVRRVELLSGMKLDLVEQTIKNIVPMPGAKQVIAALKMAGFYVYVFSGGFTLATSKFKCHLGYDFDFSNTLQIKDNKLTGKVGGPMMFQNSKGEMLLQIQSILEITDINTLVCGDGANDLSMFEHAGLKIAFGDKGVLDKHSDYVIREHSLTKILDIIDLDKLDSHNKIILKRKE